MRMNSSMLRACWRHEGLLVRHDRRTFFSSPTQKFTANRILPHSQEEVYKIISNIDSYSTFVPFCVSSRVTQHLDDLPVKADLTIGYKDYLESFTSHVRCSPPEKVEAVASGHPLFERLVTAWRLQKSGSEQCQIHLDIEYKFANPLYGALSQAVLPKVAGQIITAFEEHANKQLGHDALTR